VLLSYKRGQGSIVLRLKILDSSQITGAGLAGLTFSSTGLRVSTIADNESTATSYTAAGSTIETITTLGTYAAPTATKCRFKEVDSTNHPGLYEIQVADARYAVSSAKSLIVSVSGATNAAETDAVISLQDMDPYDATAGGLSRLDAAVSTRATPTNITAATGVVLAATGLDAVTATTPSGIPTTFPGKLLMVYQRLFGKTAKAASGTTLKVYADDNTTVIATQTWADDGAGTESLTKAV
jgi:hypothetical protein